MIEKIEVLDKNWISALLEFSKSVKSYTVAGVDYSGDEKSCKELDLLRSKLKKFKSLEIKEFQWKIVSENLMFTYKTKQSSKTVWGFNAFIRDLYNSSKSLNSYFCGNEEDWDKGTLPEISDCLDLLKVAKTICTVPPYPTYEVLISQFDSKENINRKCRAEIVSDYINEHPSNKDFKEVLTKVTLVDAIYHGQLEKKVNYEEMAKLIVGDKFSTRESSDIFQVEVDTENLEDKSLDEISMIVDVLRFRSVSLSLYETERFGSSRKGELSPVTKYIHCHAPKYPIWDNNVISIIKVWQNKYLTEGEVPKFKLKEWNSGYYMDYANVFMSLLDFINRGIPEDKQISPDQLDAALWILGGKYK